MNLAKTIIFSWTFPLYHTDSEESTLKVTGVVEAPLARKVMERKPPADGTGMWRGLFGSVLTERGPAWRRFAQLEIKDEAAAGASLPAELENPVYWELGRKSSGFALSSSMGLCGCTMQYVSLELLPSACRRIKRLYKTKKILSSTVWGMCGLHFLLLRENLLSDHFF